MAPYGLGLSFQPGQQAGGSQRPQTPVQTAIRLISTRLPSVVGAQATMRRELMADPANPPQSGPEDMTNGADFPEDLRQMGVQEARWRLDPEENDPYWDRATRRRKPPSPVFTQAIKPTGVDPAWLQQTLHG